MKKNIKTLSFIHLCCEIPEIWLCPSIYDGVSNENPWTGILGFGVFLPQMKE